MKKKLVSMLLVATALFSLTACGGKNAYEQYVEDATEKANDIQNQAQDVGEEDSVAIFNQLREYTDYMADPCFGGDEEWAFMYGCKYYLINHIDRNGGINAAPQALGFADYADYVWATCQVNGIPYEGFVKECAESIASSDYEYSYDNMYDAYTLAGKVDEHDFINTLMSVCYSPTVDIDTHDNKIYLSSENEGQGWCVSVGYNGSSKINSNYYQYGEEIYLDDDTRVLPVPITENNDVWLYFSGYENSFAGNPRTAMTFVVEDKIATVPLTLVVADIDDLCGMSSVSYAMNECGMTREEADACFDTIFWSTYKTLDDDTKAFVDGYIAKVNEVGPQDYIDRYKAFLDKHSDEIFWYPADQAEIIFTDSSDIRVNYLKVQTDYMKTVEAAELIDVADALDDYTTFVQTGEMPDDESTFGIVTTLIEKME